jgi:choline dehydrogenase-like flavoprotein
MGVTGRLPAAADTVVVGAGTAGAVVAGRLAAARSGRTLLLEAGPDYGSAGSGRWPDDLLDATSVAKWSHDWGYTGEYAGQVIRFHRARVIGGCSSHNAGEVVFGSRLDYDGWAAAGNPRWSAAELAPLFAAAWQQLRVRPVGLDELTPFQRACRDAIVAAGIPAVADFNDLSQDTGVAPVPVSVDGGTRINSKDAVLHAEVLLIAALRLPLVSLLPPCAEYDNYCGCGGGPGQDPGVLNLRRCQDARGACQQRQPCCGKRHAVSPPARTRHLVIPPG